MRLPIKETAAARTTASPCTARRVRQDRLLKKRPALCCSENVLNELVQFTFFQQLDGEAAEFFGQPENACAAGGREAGLCQSVAVLVLGLHALGDECIVGGFYVRRRIAVAVDRAFAVAVQQVLEVALKGLDQNEAFLAKPHHRIAHPQTATIPGLDSGDFGAKEAGVVAARRFKVVDQHVDVTELEIHEGFQSGGVASI